MKRWIEHGAQTQAACEEGGEETSEEGAQEMSFIAREIEKIRSAILADGNRSNELYAAQQALEWVLEPDGIASPYLMIMGTQEGLEGCLPSLCPVSSECASGDIALPGRQ